MQRALQHSMSQHVQCITSIRSTARRALSHRAFTAGVCGGTGSKVAKQLSAARHARPCSATVKQDAATADEPTSQAQATTWQPKRSSVLAALAACAVAAATAVAPAHASDIIAHVADTSLQIPGVVGDNPLREGFVSGLLLIFFSEIGDKTFFVALLLALQRDRTQVFIGTFGALAAMTVISTGLGLALHQVDELLPSSFGNFPFDDVLAAVLLIVFGIQTLRAAAEAESKAAEERKDAEEVVSTSDLTKGDALAFIASTFALVFAAEWGDKSFLATIALAAASSPAGVVTGAITGHGLATAIAVLGGSFLSDYISERVASYVGGSLFLVFAAATLFDIFTSGQATAAL